MPLITLVPAALAAPGSRFTFAGPNAGAECAGCPYQKLCFGLAPGRAYAVQKVRELTHPCNLHDGGKVHVVTVAEVPFAASLERRHLRGTAAPWAGPDCRKPSCASWNLCHPKGHAEGAKHEIVAQNGPLPCPAGFDLERVDLKQMD